MADSDAASRIAAVRAELLENLTALRRAVAATAALKNLLDDGWFEGIADEFAIRPRRIPRRPTQAGFCTTSCIRYAAWIGSKRRSN
jgi:hypothetical protein